MNAGFSSLTALKEFLLAEDLRAGTDYDEALTRLGLGVADFFGQYCNRTFARAAGATWESPADVEHVVLPRYPIESIASVALRETLAGGWVTLSNVIQQWDAASGLVWLEARQSAYPARLRWTWTGGYWWDDTEDASGSLPSGATALPEDIRTAWLLQCEALWLAHDGLGTGLAGSKTISLLGASLPGMEIIPVAREKLQRHIRYAIS